jgi:hypothetical protein
MSGFPTSITITQLPNIGNGLNYQSLFPVVDVQGTPTTDKANLQIIGNLILTSAGGSYFPPASEAILAQSVTNTAQPNITSVGTLTSLNVFGNITAGNVNGGNVITANYIVGNISGNISVANITGIGNIATVNLDGNINNVLSGTGAWVPLNRSNTNIGNITFAEANISTNLADTPIQIIGNGTGNINLKSNNAINLISSDLNNPNGGITSAWVDQANSRGGVISINDSGFPNGQGNIQLYVEKNGVPYLWTFDNTGNIVLPGNTFSVKYANGTPVPLGGGGNASPGGSNTQLQFNANGVFGGITNVTWDGSNLSLGNVTNVKISGGTNGYVLQTDGAGNLSWTAQTGNGGGNTSPGGSNTQIQFNNAGAFGANFNFTIDAQNSVMHAKNIISDNITANNTIQVTDINLAGNIVMSSGNISNANVITAQYFSGDGSNLANITGANVTGIVGNANVANFANYAGNATVATTANTVAGANVSGTVANANFAQYSGTASSANTVAGANVFGQVPYANTANNVAGANVSGQVANALVAGTVYTNAQPNITSLGTLANLSVNGLANLGNISNITITGGINGYVLQTDGAGNLTWTAQTGNGGGNGAPGGSNTQIQFNNAGTFGGTAGFTFNSTTGVLTAPNANITGTLTAANFSLAAGGNISGADVISANYFSGDGSNLANISGANVTGTVANATYATTAGTANAVAGANVSGNVANANLAGYVTQNVQSNITQVGTLSNLDVTGTTTSGNIYANSGTIAAQYLAGDGSNISNIAGGNVQGNVGNALVANFANYAGNVTVNAQPNITSVGTLANLTVGNTASNVYLDGAGNVTAGGNIVAGNFTTTGSAGNISGANVVFANSFTSNGGVVDFATNNATVQLGNVSNVHISGGTSGYVLQTDGAGNLSWVAQSGNGGGSTSNIANGTSNVSIPVVNGNINMGVGGNANVVVVTSTGANINGLLTVPNTAGGATAVALGSPTQGNLVSNAVTLTTDSSVSNAIAQLNEVLGKLVPPAPPNFPASQTIAIQGVASYRMTNYTQTDHTPGANKSVAGGTTVANVLRAATYLTSNITTAGPGNEGIVTAELNGTAAGTVTLTDTLNANGTYSNLVIYNNFDYHAANANIAPGFWSVFSAHAGGTVVQGWNEVYIADSVASNTNTTAWFYDSSNPGTPAFSSTTITPPVSPTYEYSSTVPHYTNTNIFTLAANVNRLSGNMYPTSDTFITGTAGGAFGTPGSITYAAAGITTPLAQNLYVASGNAAISTTSTVISGFGASNAAPSLSATNSYNVGTQSYTTALAANVLYKTGNVSSATVIQEANIFVGSSIGSGSGLAFRIANPGSTDTPVYTGTEAAFNSQSGPLQTYDATVVANLLAHNQTNYSTGYLPAGPNLSTGRSGAQYFTFKIVRTSVSKFNVKWSGNIAGLWVALPGSVIDTTSSLNGWLDMSVAYAGAGIPGVNSPGNGSNGCALGGPAPINTIQANASITATFGTVSSSSTATNEIYIRIKLTSGQSVTVLSLQTASN